MRRRVSRETSIEEPEWIDLRDFNRLMPETKRIFREMVVVDAGPILARLMEVNDQDRELGIDHGENYHPEKAEAFMRRSLTSRLNAMQRGLR